MRKQSSLLSWLFMAVLAVVLSSVLAFLNSKTQDHDKSAYFENLALLQHLKQLDAEWELDVLKSKIGIHLDYDALADALIDLSKLLEQLKAAIAGQKHNSASVLARSSEALRRAIEEKADLIEHFKSHNAVLRNSLVFLPTAAEDIQNSLSQAKESDQTTQRISVGVNKVLLASMVYSQAASDDTASEIQIELNALLESRRNLPAEAGGKLSLFGSHVRMVLREQEAVNELLNRIAAAPTTERFGEINSALISEQQRAATQAQLYRRYLLIFSAGLISLFLYAAIRLIRSHAVINRVNGELREANESLEQRVEERTRELQLEISERQRAEEALRAQEERTRLIVDKAFDAIVSADADGNIIEWNTQAESIFGWSRAEAVGRNLADTIIPPRYRGTHRAGLARFAAGGEGPVLNKRIEIQGVSKDGHEIPVELAITPIRVGDSYVFNAFLRDVTERKNAEADLADAHKQLVDISRQAGMAEVATNVLHNVGNVLNSVNVSAILVADLVQKTKASGVARVVALMREHEHDLGTFITQDARGRHLTTHLANLAAHLAAEQKAIVSEVDSLRSNIEHIKDIVTMQQSYAKVAGVKEIVDVVGLVEDSLRMNAGALGRHKIDVIREFQSRPRANVDKHKVLHILVNLVRNAKYACDESNASERRLTLRVLTADERVRISVIDNGVGIPPENLRRIFSHGFTTRKDGHGFGLHSGALAARELGGSLSVHSDGIGQGAAFTLELPLEPAEMTHAA